MLYLGTGVVDGTSMDVRLDVNVEKSNNCMSMSRHQNVQRNHNIEWSKSNCTVGKRTSYFCAIFHGCILQF